MSNSRVFITLATLMSVSLISNANAADEAPSWARALPFGTISCSEQSSDGVEWKDGYYRSTQYFKKRYSISKLTWGEISKTPHFCKNEDRTPASLMGDDMYWYSACYRYNNALNMLGSSQGWCTEIYRKDSPTQVICEFNQPAIAFTPAGEFIAYGRSRNLMSLEQPYIPAAFVSRGRCGGFTDASPKPLMRVK